jgi:hypothetical protein
MTFYEQVRLGNHNQNITVAAGMVVERETVKCLETMGKIVGFKEANELVLELIVL